MTTYCQDRVALNEIIFYYTWLLNNNFEMSDEDFLNLFEMSTSIVYFCGTLIIHL